MKVAFISILFIYLLGHPAPTCAQSDTSGISIIPRPLTVKAMPGQFIIRSNTRILVDAGNNELFSIGKQLAALIKRTSGITLPVLTAPAGNAASVILLTVKNAADTLGDEGYTLSAHPGKILIRAPKPAGVFYGVQTFCQLMPVDRSDSKATVIRAVEITDKPRFKWRGSMLDVGRYFYPADTIKKYLDEMAMHKLNTFHWHLTEDHGWRIEIKKYPELTKKGAWRSGTQYGHGADQVDHIPHGGYYTQEQVKDIVAYARQRYITVVPEIEMPGHSLAALTAYPELSCTGGPFTIPVQWGIQKDIFCAGNDQTFKFLEDVLTEITALFPGPYIHIGGDEAPKDRWKQCPKCQARIKAEGLKDEQELQSYFMKRITRFLRSKGKQVIGWDEILEGGLAPDAAVMSWRGTAGGIAAARQHHNVVMTPRDHLYFDFLQGDPAHEPVAIGKKGTTLETVYRYEPVAPELSPDEAKYIMGVQGAIWCEYIHSMDRVEYMNFPRTAALAEVAWTQPALKDWSDFERRMQTQYQRYKALGINYRKP